MNSMKSRGPMRSGLNRTSAEPSGSSATETVSTPFMSVRARSTAPVHAEHVMPSMSSRTLDSSTSLISSASKPASSTSVIRVAGSTVHPCSISTIALPVVTDTATRLTPGTPCNAASTAPLHAEHVMPVT